MPIYEYRCRSCKHEFEKLIFKANAAVQCPRCGKSRVEKLYSSFAAVGSTKGKGSSCTSCTSKSCSTCGSS